MCKRPKSPKKDPESAEAGSDAPSTPSQGVADRELHLYLDDHDDLILPEPPDEGEEDGVVASAAWVLESLDPIKQVGVKDDPPSGKRLLPGMVPLAPISMAAVAVSAVALIASISFSLQYAKEYLLAFAIAHLIFFGHVWTYHLGYRTQRRFLVFRQTVFITGLVVFVDWMLLDMVANPPSIARVKAQISDTFATYLWVAFYCNAVAGGLIVLHWLVLGRGYRAVPSSRRSS